MAKNILFILILMLASPHLSNANDDLLEMRPYERPRGILQVYIDCYLPDTSISCEQLKAAYFNSISLVRPSENQKAADVSIQVRATLIAEGIQYSIAFEGRGDLPKFTILDRVSENVSDQGQFIRLIANIDKGTAPYLALNEPSTSNNGFVKMVFSDGTEQTKPKDDNRQTKWYISPRLSGSFSRGEMSSVSASGSVYMNWSDPSWRFQVSTSANYQDLSIPIGGGQILKAEVFSYGEKTIISYNIAKKWSVAALLSAWHEPGSNMTYTIDTMAGLEWNLVPMMKANDKTIAIRYAIGPEFNGYILPNIKNKQDEIFLWHSLKAYLVWHFKNTDLKFSLGTGSPVTDTHFFKINSSAGLTFRITKGLSISPSINASYTPALIYEPLNPDYSNPIQTMFTGGYSEFSISGNFSITYTFGNSLLKNQDQRWLDQ